MGITLVSEYKEAEKKLIDSATENPLNESVQPIEPLKGYAESQPMVYCGLFPVDADDYEGLRESLGKLQLNDAALCYNLKLLAQWDSGSDVVFWDYSIWKLSRNVFHENTKLI